MIDEQIDKMLEMHRYLMKCEIKHAFDKFCAENGNQDYSDANLQEAHNDTEWKKFAEWFTTIREV